MSFFKRKVEALQTKRAERENLKGFEDIFRKPLAQLQAIFATSVDLGERARKLPSYPGVRHLGELGIHAFGLIYHVEPARFPVLLNLVKDGRQEVEYFHFVRDEGGQSSSSFHTLVSLESRFSGRDVRLLSDDMELLSTLAMQGFHPPPPWIALFEFGPTLHVSQGDPHDWMGSVWDPFWESLSLDEQARFLENRRKETASFISEDDWQLWVESIRMRDARYREIDG